MMTVRSPSFLSPLQYGKTLFVLVLMLLIFFLTDPARFIGWFEEQVHTYPPAAEVVKDVEAGAERLGLMRSADAQKRFVQALQLRETGGGVKPQGAGQTTVQGEESGEPVVPWDKVLAYCTGLPKRLCGKGPAAVNASAFLTVNGTLSPGNATLPAVNGTLPENGATALPGVSGVNGTLPGASNGTDLRCNGTLGAVNCTNLTSNSTLGAANGTVPESNGTVVPPVASLVPLGEGVKGKVLLAGDSMMMEGLGPVLLRFLRGHGGVEVTREAVYSTGLCRADYFDWPAHMKNVVERHKPHLVIICLGANDGQDIVDENKKRHIAGTDTWKVHYRQRAKLLLAAAQSTGARVIWVGLPIMGKEPHGTYIKAVVAEQRAACEETPSSLFIDTWATLAGEKGEFLSFVQGKDKAHIRIRSNDKVHVTEAGGTILLADIRPVLEVMFVHPPAVNATAVNATAGNIAAVNGTVPVMNGTSLAAKNATAPADSTSPQANGSVSAVQGGPPASSGGAGKSALAGVRDAAVSPTGMQPATPKTGPKTAMSAKGNSGENATASKKAGGTKAGTTAEKTNTPSVHEKKTPSPTTPSAAGNGRPQI